MTPDQWREKAEKASRKLTAVEVLEAMVISAFEDGRDQGYKRGRYDEKIRAATRILDSDEGE